MSAGIIGAGLQLIGAMQQHGSATAADEDIARNFRMEAALRKGLESKSRAAFDLALAGIDPRVMAALHSTRLNATQGATLPTTRMAFGPAAGSGASPASVGRSVDRNMVRGNADAARNAKLIAELSRGPDFFNAAAARGNEAGETVTTMQDFIRGNQATLGLQNSAADASRKNLIADLLMGGGQIVGGLNMFGGGSKVAGGGGGLIPSGGR